MGRLAAAQITETITETMRRVLAGFGEVADVGCSCGNVCAVWSSLTRCLYRRRGLDLPLGGPRSNVLVRCDRCGARYHTSGRAVGYRLRKGLPPLP